MIVLRAKEIDDDEKHEDKESKSTDQSIIGNLRTMHFQKQQTESKKRKETEGWDGGRLLNLGINSKSLSKIFIWKE